MELYKIRKTSRQSNPFRFTAVKQLHPGRLPVIKKQYERKRNVQGRKVNINIRIHTKQGQ